MYKRKKFFTRPGFFTNLLLSHKDSNRFYCNLLRWLYRYSYHLDQGIQTTWRTNFQSFYGNIFDIIPFGKNIERFPKHHHAFHILPASPWPFCVSLSLLTFVSGILDFLNTEIHFGRFLSLGLFCVCFCLWCWWGDVIEESLTEHTKRIKYGIAIGMVLFIISEVMFFFSFFWAFFHVSLSPSIELGCVWPPKGLENLVISPFGAPLLNTIILVSSGVTLTCAHYAFLIFCYRMRIFANYMTLLSLLGLFKGLWMRAMIRKFLLIQAEYVEGYHLFFTREFWLKHKNVLKVFSRASALHFYTIKSRLFHKILLKITFSKYNSKMVCIYTYFLATLLLAIFFTISQGLEYISAAVCISDGVYGSTFYIMTGFHGFHVIVGTIFLIVCFVRILIRSFSYVHFIGLEAAIWYWHFVDVVWLFLYLFVYVWGNGLIPVVDLNIFNIPVAADFAYNYQIDFQDSASFLMEAIVDLHNYIMFYLFIVLGLVGWLLISFLVDFPASSVVFAFKILLFGFKDMHFRELAVRRLIV